MASISKIIRKRVIVHAYASAVAKGILYVVPTLRLDWRQKIYSDDVKFALDIVLSILKLNIGTGITVISNKKEQEL